MRIAILTTYLAVGEQIDSGIGQHFRILADALTEKSHEVHVFLISDGHTGGAARVSLEKDPPTWSWTIVDSAMPDWLSGLSGWSWPLKQLAGHLWSAWKAKAAVLHAHQNRKFQILETHSYNLPGFFLNRARHRPPVLTRVSTTTGQMISRSPLQSRVLKLVAALERRVIRQSSALVTHTVQHRDAVSSEEKLDPSRFEIVPHGLPDVNRSPGNEPRSTGSKVEILFVGRFESRKGVDVLLECVPSVIDACPDVVLTLAGSRGDGHTWENFVNKNPDLAGSSVNSLGRVSSAELSALYQRCDLLVAPSRYESFGLIYVEAMIFGKPVIGCSVGGIPEVVTHGIEGLLVPVGDSSALAEAMIRLVNDEECRERLGRNGRQKFLEHFSSEIMADRSVKLYEKLSVGFE